MLTQFKATNHRRYKDGDKNVDDRALPPADFAPLFARFQFSIDAAASEANTKLPRFWTAKTNGLKHSWANERVYCNPPYSSIRPWIIKAWNETDCPLIVMLLPANRTEQSFWQELIEPMRDRPGSPLRTEFLRDRIRFLKSGAASIRPNERPPFGCCLCIWDRAKPAAMNPFVTNPLNIPGIT